MTTLAIDIGGTGFSVGGADMTTWTVGIGARFCVGRRECRKRLARNIRGTRLSVATERT